MKGATDSDGCGGRQPCQLADERGGVGNRPCGGGAAYGREQRSEILGGLTERESRNTIAVGAANAQIILTLADVLMRREVQHNLIYETGRQV